MEPSPEQLKTGFNWLQISQHLRNPQNLLTYMIFTAWCKFMGVAQHLPSISVA